MDYLSLRGLQSQPEETRLGALIIVSGQKRHEGAHEASKWLVSHSPFIIRNKYALTLMVLCRDVGRGDSNQRPFEKVGGNQVSLECLGHDTDDICSRLLIVIVAGS